MCNSSVHCYQIEILGPWDKEETEFLFMALLLRQHVTWSRVLAPFLEWNGTSVGMSACQGNQLTGNEPPCTNKHKQGLWPLMFLPCEQKGVWSLICLFVFFSKARSDLLMASAVQILSMMTRFLSKQVNKLSNYSLGLVWHCCGHCTVITKDSSCSAKPQN